MLLISQIDPLQPLISVTGRSLPELVPLAMLRMLNPLVTLGQGWVQRGPRERGISGVRAGGYSGSEEGSTIGSEGGGGGCCGGRA